MEIREEQKCVKYKKYLVKKEDWENLSYLDNFRGDTNRGRLFEERGNIFNELSNATYKYEIVTGLEPSYIQMDCTFKEASEMLGITFDYLCSLKTKDLPTVNEINNKLILLRDVELLYNNLRERSLIVSTGVLSATWKEPFRRFLTGLLKGTGNESVLDSGELFLWLRSFNSPSDILYQLWQKELHPEGFGLRYFYEIEGSGVSYKSLNDVSNEAGFNDVFGDIILGLRPYDVYYSNIGLRNWTMCVSDLVNNRDLDGWSLFRSVSASYLFWKQYTFTEDTIKVPPQYSIAVREDVQELEKKHKNRRQYYKKSREWYRKNINVFESNGVGEYNTGFFLNEEGYLKSFARCRDGIPEYGNEFLYKGVMWRDLRSFLSEFNIRVSDEIILLGDNYGSDEVVKLIEITLSVSKNELGGSFGLFCSKDFSKELADLVENERCSRDLYIKSTNGFNKMPTEEDKATDTVVLQEEYGSVREFKGTRNGVSYKVDLDEDGVLTGNGWDKLVGFAIEVNGIAYTLQGAIKAGNVPSQLVSEWKSSLSHGEKYKTLVPLNEAGYFILTDEHLQMYLRDKFGIDSKEAELYAKKYKKGELDDLLKKETIRVGSKEFSSLMDYVSFIKKPGTSGEELVSIGQKGFKNIQRFLEEDVKNFEKYFKKVVRVVEKSYQWKGEWYFKCVVFGDYTYLSYGEMIDLL